MIFETSGSSGIPKKLALSADLRLLRAQRRAVCKGPGYALLRSMLCLVRQGSTSYQSHKDFAASRDMLFLDTDATASEVVENSVEGVVGSPDDLRTLAVKSGGFHRFRYVLSTGDYLSPDTAKLVRQTLLAEAGVAVVTYGCSEVGTVARGTFSQAETTPGCVGELCYGVQLVVVDGRVRVRTPTMIHGYVDASLDASHFVDGWFVPGDRGRMLPSGVLVLEPRIP